MDDAVVSVVVYPGWCSRVVPRVVYAMVYWSWALEPGPWSLGLDLAPGSGLWLWILALVLALDPGSGPWL